MHDEGRDEEIRRLREEMESLQERLRRLAQEPPPEGEPEEQREEEQAEAPEPERTEEAQQPPEEAHEEPEREEEPEEKEYERDYGRRHEYGPYGFEDRMEDFGERMGEFGERLGDYIESVVEGVMSGVSAELERSLIVEPRRRRERGARKRRRSEEELKGAASAMSALGNENRIAILDALSSGGLYASDLQETLPEISPSTLSSHLDVLEEAGLVVQERRRGRYLITLPGRLAVKMAYQIARRAGRPPREG